MPTPELARALDRVFATPGFTEDTPGVPGTPGTFGRLVVRLRNLPFPASFRSFAPHEAEATALYTFEHSLIPGLLQTEAYARAILETHPDVTEDVVSERLAGRLSRQAILDRDDPPPPVVCALIDQSALDREIGGPVVMREQLVHLAVMSAARTSRSRSSRTRGASGPPGCVYRRGPGRFARYREHGGHYGRAGDRGRRTVSMVALRFHTLRGDALSKGASRDLIEGVIQERWKETAP